jgi:hypothetical protein
MVRRPTYYAVFDSVEGTFLEPSFSSSSEKADLGSFSITMDVRYLLPLETGLRIIVTGFNGSSEVLRVEESITQTESTERTATYTYEYTFPLLSMYEGDYMIGFDASVEYLVEGTWYSGDDETFNVSVSILHPEGSIERPSQNILDDIRKAFLDFYEWWRRFFE